MKNITGSGGSRPDSGTNEREGNISKNLSASYKEAYGQKAAPSAGSSIPAGKNRGEKDTLTGNSKKESVTEAHATSGACKKAIDRQCGHANELSDNEPHDNSGLGNTATDVLKTK